MVDINWIEEATGTFNDIKPFTKDVHLSKNQPDVENFVLINLETFEGDKFCIRLCEYGFAVVSRSYDTINKTEVGEYYETAYAMLSKLSRSYVQRFNEFLAKRLEELQNNSE